MIGVGIMSGTSLDGVDTVLVEVTGSGLETAIKVLGYNEYPISDYYRSKIKKASTEETSRVDLLCSLNFELGQLFSDAVTVLLNMTGYGDEDLDFIASHGQTIYHLPEGGHDLVASTLQIGEPAVIAYNHNTQVISDFRVMDVAAKGQGAPLVPYSEYVLYGKTGKNIALQNIGGISNVTFLPGGIEGIVAFDTGPGNMMINEACNQLYGLPYDKDGLIAAAGKVDDRILGELMNHNYFDKLPPKSTGREDFGEKYTGDLLKRHHKTAPEDIVATLTMFTAKCIAFHYQRDILEKFRIDEVIIGGGGSHNLTLVGWIKDELDPIKVVTQDEIGYSSDAKEAIAFAVLGNETLHGNPANVINATGAKRPVVLGKITPKPY